MGRSHSGYRETMITDYRTGLVTNVRFGFGKLWHTGFGEDPALEWDDALTEEEKDEMVEGSEKRIAEVTGKYSSVDAAMRALIDAGYEKDEVYELEWY